MEGIYGILCVLPYRDILVWMHLCHLPFRIALAKRKGLPDGNNFQRWKPMIVALLILTIVVCFPLGLWEAFQTTTVAVTTLSILYNSECIGDS
jgi:hypothetical protein